MNPPRVVIWDNYALMSTVVRLEHDGRFVEQHIYREEAVDCPDPVALMLRTLELLCIEWQKKFGGLPLAIVPKAENTEWSVYYDNTIDGEVVVKEIEGGDKNASRGCIEGR